MKLVLPVYNVHPYLSLKNLGKNVCIIPGKRQCFKAQSQWFLVYFQCWSTITTI